MNKTQPAVFISYSHDSDAHKERVRALSERLRVDGICCQIDQYIQNPREGWPRWCERAIETSNFVLVVCTETYHRRYSGREEAGKGKGVTFEGYIITQQFYDKGPLNEKFLPVLFAPEDENFIPTPLRGASRYLVETAGGYEALYRLLTGQPAITPPPIGTPRILPPRPSVVAAITDQSHRTFLVKLPTTSSLLFGREQELAVLDQAWQDRHTRIVTLVAMGGAGKSALVNEWLNRLERDNYRGAVRVYGWSFYSQGAREDGQASADEFLDHALGWFGDTTLAKNASVWDKGIRLAEVIGNQPALLILDGLEPLQYPPGEMYGQLKDQGLQALLKALARNNLQTGLCVVTSRVGVTDLEHFLSGPVRRLDLESLDPEAGEKLLSSLGVTGVPAELRQAAGEFGGHALALTLLGTYLAAVHDGDIRQRDKVGSLFAEEKKGGHAKRVMASYCQWLAGKTELDILFLMGLFDRPADGGAVAILRKPPAIAGLTSQLTGLTEAKWKVALANLRDLRLLAPRNQARPDTLDCHPLVREHMADLLQKQLPAAWQDGNLRLYEHYKGIAKELPDTIEEMTPLFYACAHGCRAGRQQEAFDLVYWQRIKRGDEHYSTRKLGAFGADLAALANFFEELWDRPATRLAEDDQAAVLNRVGFSLRALGRLAEAVGPMRAGLEMRIRQENWENAAIATSNLSQLFLVLGAILFT